MCAAALAPPLAHMPCIVVPEGGRTIALIYASLGLTQLDGYIHQHN